MLDTRMRVLSIAISRSHIIRIKKIAIFSKFTVFKISKTDILRKMTISMIFFGVHNRNTKDMGPGFFDELKVGKRWSFVFRIVWFIFGLCRHIVGISLNFALGPIH